MVKVPIKMMLFGLVSFFCLGGFAAGQKIADRSKPTGLKPIDAAQIRKIEQKWPRIKKVHLNELGLERVNAERTKKGKPPLAPGTLKPTGQDLESAIKEPGVMLQALAPGTEILADLPPSIDNSQLPYFPPIRDQGMINSCASFATTYTQFSYMSAFQKGLDIRNDSDNTNKYSPKWTYNMVNNGEDIGSYIDDNYGLLESHGAATWSEFPYDGVDYLAWCLTSNAWRNAISTRTRPTQYVDGANTENGMAQIKELLNNGYVVVFGTFIYSWQGQFIMDDPATPDDDGEVGKGIGYFVNGNEGSHAMTIVGYNDAIWTDVNGNAVVDPGEKGAFKIANSWGAGWQDAGFIWLAYDALRTVSALPDGPSDNRFTALQGNRVFVMTARDDYSPSMIAELTVNHAKRTQLGITLGWSDTASTMPTIQWYPTALAYKGGAFAFDGSTSAVDGTFFLDFTDLLSETSVERRYYLGIWDNDAGDPATLKAFKIVDLTTDPDTETSCVTTLPVYAENSGAATYAFAQYTYGGNTVNRPPVLANVLVNPEVGSVADWFFYQIFFSDPDGDSSAIKSLYIDGVPYDMTEYVDFPGWHYFSTQLPVGSHNYRFYFTDSRGESVSAPAVGTHSGPVVTLTHFVSTPVAPTGASISISGIPHSYETLGSTCSDAHDLQYRFDWGDGTLSNWLPVGQTSAPHSWSGAGSYAVRVQARCAFETSIVSSWSDPYIVTVPAGIPFNEGFASAGFPGGWIQQHIGTDSYNAWMLTPSSEAGGQPYEMKCEFADVVPGTTRLVTAPINTTGYASLRLRFKHFIKTWDGGGAQFRIQTSTDKISWTDEAWSVAVGSSDIGPATVDTVITANLNHQTTYVAFVITGDLYNFDYWYIDDVSLSRAFSPKVDFNGDGQEDILWRYNGPGGNIRAWFLGDLGPGSPALLASSVTLASDSGLSSMRREIAPRAAMEGLRKMRGLPSNKVRNATRSPGNLMGGTARSKGRARVVDPRQAGGKKLASSANGISDPRQATAAPGILRPADAPIELAASPTYLGGADIMPVGDLDWQIVGTGDFDNDSQIDLLWRNVVSGINVVWLMNGTEWKGSAELLPVGDMTWQIVGTGDFNRDGHVDILWRNSASGDNVVWHMNGTQWTGSAALIGVSDQTWKIVGTGDFNKDGNVDILWRYEGAGGYNVVWYLNNATWIGSAELISVGDTVWQIMATGDYNNDGNVDILWRYNGAGGYNVIWYMNGVAWAESAELLPVPDLAWRIVSR